MTFLSTCVLNLVVLCTVSHYNICTGIEMTASGHFQVATVKVMNVKTSCKSRKTLAALNPWKISVCVAI